MSGLRTPLRATLALLVLLAPASLPLGAAAQAPAPAAPPAKAPAAGQPAAAPAVPPAPGPEELFQSGQWEKSVTANEAVVKADPKNGRAWFRLGLSQIQLKHYDAASDAFDHAEAAGYSQSPYLRYGRAAIAAARHQKENALKALDAAVTLGFANEQLVTSDENFKAFAADPDYQKLLLRIRRPCEADPAYHALDFWLGHWEVFSAGEKDGTNFIEKTLNGCAVIENWVDVNGHEGKSLFYYSPVTHKHKQVWVTDSGPFKEKAEVEAPEKGSIRFQGELPQRDGSKILDRTTLTPLPGDRVRQVIEQSHDGGKTWDVGYDAIYERPKTPPAK
jgi:tetratricopeptide (TPR) repeat protein